MARGIVFSGRQLFSAVELGLNLGVFTVSGYHGFEFGQFYPDLARTVRVNGNFRVSLESGQLFVPSGDFFKSVSHFR